MNLACATREEALRQTRQGIYRGNARNEKNIHQRRRKEAIPNARLAGRRGGDSVRRRRPAMCQWGRRQTSTQMPCIISHCTRKRTTPQQPRHARCMVPIPMSWWTQSGLWAYVPHKPEAGAPQSKVPEPQTAICPALLLPLHNSNATARTFGGLRTLVHFPTRRLQFALRSWRVHRRLMNPPEGAAMAPAPTSQRNAPALSKSKSACSSAGAIAVARGDTGAWPLGGFGSVTTTLMLARIQYASMPCVGMLV